MDDSEDVVTAVSNEATRARAIVHMRVLEAAARSVPFGREARVVHWVSDDVPDGYVRVWWGLDVTFVEAKVVDFRGDPEQAIERLDRTISVARAARASAGAAR